MSTPQEIIEIERIVNLAKAFDWDKVAETAENGVLRITLEKRVAPVVSETSEG